MQHHGIAAQMMEEVIHYAEQNHMMISLETHNEKNVAMYEHFGFKLFGIVKKHFELKQYCLCLLYTSFERTAQKLKSRRKK